MPEDLPPPMRLASASMLTSERPRAKTMANEERNFTCFSCKNKEFALHSENNAVRPEPVKASLIAQQRNIDAFLLRVKSNFL
jgi:hypothetical protein